MLDRKYLLGKILAWIVLAIVLMSATVLLFWNLGRGSIDLWDESLTAGRSLYVHQGHDLTGIEINGEVSNRKPPLIYAVTGFLFDRFEVSEWYLRLPGATFSLLTLLLVSYAAFQVNGHVAAVVATFMLAGTVQFYEISREALTDSAFMFGLTLAAISLSGLFGNRGRGSTNLLWFGFAAGLLIASLVKGFAAHVIVLYALVFFFLADRRACFPLIASALISSFPLLIWIALEASQDSSFLRAYFGQEYFQRFSYGSSFLSGHVKPPTWYASHLFQWFGFTPIAFTVGGIFFVLQHKKCEGQVFLVGFVLFFFLVVSVASHKQDRYLAPLYPLVAFSIGIVASYLVSSGRLIYTSLVAGALVLTIAINIVSVFENYDANLDHFPNSKAVGQRLAILQKPGDMVVADNLLSTYLLHFYTQELVSNNAFTLYLGQNEGRSFLVRTTEGNVDDAEIVPWQSICSEISEGGTVTVTTGLQTYTPGSAMEISISTDEQTLVGANVYLGVTKGHLAFPFSASGELDWRYAPVANLDRSLRLRLETHVDQRLRADRYNICALITTTKIFAPGGKYAVGCTGFEIVEIPWWPFSLGKRGP